MPELGHEIWSLVWGMLTLLCAEEVGYLEKLASEELYGDAWEVSVGSGLPLSRYTSARRVSFFSF